MGFFREMQGRIVELIGRINHDEVTAELLRLNDELNNLFLRHQRYEKNRDPQNASTPSAILGVAMGVPISNGRFDFFNREQTVFRQSLMFLGDRGKDSLIDLSDEAVGVSDGLPANFSGLGSLKLNDFLRITQIFIVNFFSQALERHHLNYPVLIPYLFNQVPLIPKTLMNSICWPNQETQLSKLQNQRKTILIQIDRLDA